MLANKDYSKMPLEGLVESEKKVKSQRTMNALLMGVMFGLAVYSATHHKGFIITVLLLFIPFWMGRKNSQNLKDIQAELRRRA